VFFHLRYSATVVDVDYTANKQLKKNTFQKLGLLDLVHSLENLIITGVTWTGKSYLVQALRSQACMISMKILANNMARLIDHLKLPGWKGVIPNHSCHRKS